MFPVPRPCDFGPCQYYESSEVKLIKPWQLQYVGSDHEVCSLEVYSLKIYSLDFCSFYIIPFKST